ncbi:MAG: diguanylate cyclase [Nitrospirae bacterium]|nr:diguanylate cyclase [Nitrospirota bacterium]
MSDSNYPIKVAADIRKLLIKAIKQKAWYFFKNPRLCKCWEERNCTNTGCPAYKSSNLRCWQIAGTFCCKGKPVGVFAKKLGDCHKCKVYKKATEGDIMLQIGEDFNNLMFQLETKEDDLKLSMHNCEDKNKHLRALNKEIKKLLKNLDDKNKQLRELSIKDELTGLYNHRYFSKMLNDQYKLAKRYKFPLSCIMIDIDFFKAVNDAYGHQFGDVILKQFADILRSNFRDTDKVVRYGGEEFAILLPHTDYKNAYIKGEGLRKLVSEFAFKLRDKTLYITISLGIANYPANKNIIRAEHLVKYADKALYQAKARGRDQTIVYNEGEIVIESKKIDDIKYLMEKRKYPRIQTLIKIRSEINKKESFFSNAFDISCSGLSLLSKKPINCGKILSIKLYLPDMEKRANRALQIVLESVVVWCKRIGDLSYMGNGSKQEIEASYMIGIQFRDISQINRKCLQKYFVSIFKKRSCLHFSY